MKTVKGYNKVQSKNKIFGLEFFDLFILAFVYLIVFVFSSNLILNSAILFGAYLILRIYKKGKPPHFTGSVIRFISRRKTYPPKRERKGDVFKK